MRRNIRCWNKQGKTDTDREPQTSCLWRFVVLYFITGENKVLQKTLLIIKRTIEFVRRSIIVRRDTMDNSTPNIPHDKLPEEIKLKIQKTLEERGAMLPCPRCGNNRFILADGLIVPPIQTGLSNFILGGSTIPSAAVVCSRCGYLSLHAIGILGVMEELEKAEKGHE